MSAPTTLRFLHTATITLSGTPNTKQNLMTLLNAIETFPNLCRELCIQSETSNASSNVWVGDVNLSTSSRGFTLTPGDSKAYTCAAASYVNTNDFFIMSDTASMLVNISVIEPG